MALLTKNFNQVARKMNKRLKGTYQPKNTTFAFNPPIVPFKVNRFPRVNTDSTNKSKGIQCRECEGYGHIQAEGANTHKKNKSYTTTFNDEEFKEWEEPFNELMVLISLASIEDPSVDAAPRAASSSQALVVCVATEVESNDDEEISDDEMVCSYKVMYEKLMEALNENKELHKQVSQLCSEKEELVKQNNVFLDKVCEQEEIINELEQMKKTVRILNSGTTTLE